MPNMTLALDAETLKAMKAHPEIRWSEVARKAFREKLARLKVIDELDKAFADSRLTPKDIDRLAKEAKRRMAEDLRAFRDAARH